MRFILLFVASLWSFPAFPQCVGENLLETMPADKRAELDAATSSHPYPSGNLWRAQKGDSIIHVMGTIHLSDPRLDAYLAPLWPIVDASDLIMLEADSKSIEALKSAMLTDASLMFITDGLTLPERLSPEDWESVTTKMSARGFPGFMVSKMQPWYVSLMLSIPPCAMASLAKQNGVDQRIMARAEAKTIPTRSLEDYNVVFSAFRSMEDGTDLDMIRMALASDTNADAMTYTTIEIYLSGNHRQIWELSRHHAYEVANPTNQDIEKVFSEMEAVLLNDRNISWVPVILDAARESKSILVAVGAAHLSGKTGLLYQLEQAGYTLTRNKDY